MTRREPSSQRQLRIPRKKHRKAASAACAALLALSQPATAQRLQLDVTGLRVSFDTLSALNSASLSPVLEWQTSRWFAFLNGSIAGFENGDWAAQGRADASLLVAPFGPLSSSRLELVGVAAGTYHSSNFRTASTRGELRYHLLGRLAGAWLGAGAATGWSSAEGALLSAAGPTAGLWARYATARAALVFSPLRIQGFWFPEINARASIVAGPLEAAGYAGWRGGVAGSNVPDATAWGGVTAALWLGNSVALQAAAGTYPQDLLQGLPAGTYLSAGVRIATGRAAVPSIRPLGRPAYERTDGSGLLRFRVSEARRVDLVGDWTGWEPVPMERAADGSWFVRVRLQPGVYRFNLIVDGQRWIVPDGVVAIDDGYGGKTGLLIIPSDR
ncbi:MAG: hypothetical protein KatS3mg081_0708 [Gemmatimonadales bacterium]|nr:MAG: hypothetical protein KatS3mg081_0708 [Gemmatimonadales bacterium]